ncbi:hypothetical protein MASR1M32_39330 [Rhodobacter sp.]
MTLQDPALAELRANVAQPFARAQAMPKADYTSESFAALEQRHIFGREWLCTGRAGGLPDPGDYLTMEISGEPIIVLRGGDGQLRGLSNGCGGLCAGFSAPGVLLERPNSDFARWITSKIPQAQD